MSSLLESVLKQLSGSGMSGIAQHIGAGEKETSAASGAAVTTLLSALARNAKSGQGAEALQGALERDHDGGLLNDLPGFLKNPEIGKGDGILGHVLGAKRPVVERSVAKASGLEARQAGKLLAALAPIVMGALGQQQRRQNLNASSLAQFLGGEQQEIERKQPGAGGILSALLDQDGDGDVDIADLAKHGKGLLGRFFSK
jgi:hypothetical protein